MSSRHPLLSALPPNAVVHLPASEFIDLVEELRALRHEQAEIKAIVENSGLTRAQIAQRTGRSVATVGEWVREGKMAGGQRHYLNENALTGLTTVSDFNAFYALFNNSNSPQE